MKKIILSVLLLGATLMTASAQLLPSFQMGIKGGANFATLKDVGTSTSTRTGYLAGIWTRIGGAGMHLQPELYITSKGSDLKAQGGKVDFTTIDLPVLLGTRIGLGPIAARVQAGPVISFVLDENNKFRENVGQVADFSNYKNQTIGLTGGLGVDIMKLRADLRYEHGLSKVLKSGNDMNGKMRLWTLSIGYRLF